jgi:TonB family protein
MKYIPLCLLLTAAAALAQPVPLPALPAALGAPHVCISDYPPAAIAARAEGTTTVGFTITESGKVADVRVVTSSGNEDLDNAAVTCADRWIYRPAQKDGKPVAVPWRATVRWAFALGDATLFAPTPLEQPHDCSAFAPAGGAIPPGAVTTLRFHVTAEGKVTDIILDASSGSLALDKAAMRCAAGWTFKPALIDGKPVEGNWRENIAWK